ncbi:hypothetical protein ACGTRS_29935, partial [Burkholderia semiarida]
MKNSVERAILHSHRKAEVSLHVRSEYSRRTILHNIPRLQVPSCPHLVLFKKNRIGHNLAWS